MGAEQLFSGISVPGELSREYLTRVDYGRLRLDELERVKIGKIVEVLSHPELEHMVRQGYITLAMIKPGSDRNNYDYSDLSAAEAIEGEIKDPLKVVFGVSVRFDGRDVDEFYAGDAKKAQVKAPPIVYTDYPSRWEEFKAMMISGPTTVLLLSSEYRNAVREWRDQIGDWNVEKHRKKPWFLNNQRKTIRGRWAKDNYTSIVHGSDGPNTAIREIRVVRNNLMRLTI